MIALFCLIFFSYMCGDSLCLTNSSSVDLAFHYEFNQNTLDKSRHIDLESNDILVFVHIQKTGGSTFGRNLVKNLDVDPPCQCFPNKKGCSCRTKNNQLWLFSRYSTGWVCGVHADWTEINDCMEEWFQKHDVKSRKRRRFVLSLIRALAVIPQECQLLWRSK